ncbi:unnamed protein product [Lactuca virosa]|uniref:Uncharacterized protein n=1 Tax=Lactuca virosa TaxID=75947 RepID=A0AAU9ME49_9ASTR|nr:unnamed protein product [Lactuca virosa]
MSILTGNLFFFFSFIFIYFITTITLAQPPDFLSYFCDSDMNYTANSAYQRNLDTTLAVLPTTNSGFGFFNRSTGEGINRVNSVALCRGDVNPDSCLSCVNDSIVKLREICPNQKEGIGYYDYCMLKYSNATILRNTAIRFYVYLANPNNASNINQFNNALSPLMENLTVRAASGGPALKFASGNTSGPDFTRIYALVQCTPDLSELQCSNCLSDAISRIGVWFNGKVGGRILLPMCTFRYEIYRFFNESSLVVGPPPSSPPPPPILSPSRPIPPPPGKSKNNTTQTVIIIVIAVGTAIIIASICIFIALKRKKKQMPPPPLQQPENSETGTMDIGAADALQYNFSIVRAATNDFSKENKLGRGGFGVVYKGKLEDGQEVAVKRLGRDSGQGDVEFKNEVLLVAKLQHRNLVRLLGFSIEGSERLLIYEYLPNASLDQFIFDPTKHFGMARLFKPEETQGDTSRIVGTYGYMAPEYAMHGQFSVKSDVFSFGVLVLEMVTGQKNQCFRNGDSVEDLLSFAWKSWRNGTVTDMIDPTLKTGSGSLRDVIRSIHIGLLCVQENVIDRPTMASVVLMLNSFSITLPVPSEPAFFMRSTIDPEMPHLSEFSSSNSGSSGFGKPKISKSKSRSSQVSLNDVSISEIIPR